MHIDTYDLASWRTIYIQMRRFVSIRASSSCVTDTYQRILVLDGHNLNMMVSVEPW